MEKDKNAIGSYALGTLGALIGGLIATLPWILMYVYANMMWSFMAIFIAMGAYKGYELLKGKIDNKVPYIIGVVSFIAITVATLFVIPHLLLIKEYGSTSMDLFKALYSFGEFKGAIMGDYVYSLLFTILGAGGVINSIKRSIEDGDEKVSFNKPLYAPNDEDIDEVKKFFVEKGATSKEHTLSKTEVFDELKKQENVIKFLMTRGIIIRKNNQYYYSLENEQHPGKRTMKVFLITFGVMMAFVILAVVLATALS